MIYILCFVTLIIGLLSFSGIKSAGGYKDEGIRLMLPLYLAGDTVSRIMPGGVRIALERRLRLISARGTVYVKEEADRFIVDAAAKAFLIIISFLIIAAALGASGNRGGRIIERPGVGMADEEKVVTLSDSEGESDEVLSIHSRIYTKDEYDAAAENASDYIEKVWLGDNESSSGVSGQLHFPARDETGTLKIEWETGDPSLITRYGEVHNEDLTEGKEVMITARITDGNYETEKTLTANVIPAVEEMSEADIAASKLQTIEEEMREEAIFTLPDSIDGYSIEAADERKGYGVRIALLGMVAAAAFIAIKLSRLRDSEKKRDDALRDSYPVFVSKLSLMMGAGCSVNGALEMIYEEGMRDESSIDHVLIREIGTFLSGIRNGVAEPDALSDLARRIGIREYTRLIALINQNIHHGNRDLLMLLEEEQSSNEFLNKERVRRRGEEASEKLVFPMIVLLAVVIVIVLYPAMINM